MARCRFLPILASLAVFLILQPPVLVRMAWAEDPPPFVLTWGSYGRGPGQFDEPYGVTVGPAGEVYVVDTSNNRIQKFTANGAYLMEWGSLGGGAGEFRYPLGVATDAVGDVYVADNANHRIQKFTADGLYLTEWGWGSYGNGNGQFTGPCAVTTDAAGDVYVADHHNHRIQKFSANGTYLAQWGSLGEDNGQFAFPTGVATDVAGDIYVVDQLNNRIQKFTAGGTYLTQWSVENPYGVATDAVGNVYVVGPSYPARVQKFTTNGVYLTQWGSSGGGNGQFHDPLGVATDAAGNVYVADRSNNRIQKFGLGCATGSITVAVQGGTWERPAAPDLAAPIASARVDLLRDGSPISSFLTDATGHIYLAGTFQTGDQLECFLELDRLKVVDCGDPNSQPCDASQHFVRLPPQSINCSPVVSIEWPQLSGYSGDGVNAFVMAERFGREYWRDRLQSLPFLTVLRVNDPSTTLRDSYGGAATNALRVAGQAASSIALSPGRGAFQDAVLHEFSHGMIIQSVGDHLSSKDGVDREDSEAKAVDEGLADYFTTACTGRSTIDVPHVGKRELNQGDDPIRMPWCNGRYDSGRSTRGYYASQAVSGALYDLRQALRARGPTFDEIDRWIYGVLGEFEDLPVSERHSRRLRTLLDSTALSGGSYPLEIAAAFDRHNIKSPPAETCLSGPAIRFFDRTVDAAGQVLSIGWSPSPGAQFSRVYKRSWSVSGAGVGPGYIIADDLVDSSFVYADSDTTVKIALTVVAVDSAGREGPSSDETPQVVDVDPAGSRATPRPWLSMAPNPFRGRLVLSFSLPAAGRVVLKIFDVSGRHVRTLVDGQQGAGRQTVVWDGSDDSGAPLAAGVYFIRLAGPGVGLTRKAVVLE